MPFPIFPSHPSTTFVLNQATPSFHNTSRGSLQLSCHKTWDGNNWRINHNTYHVTVSRLNLIFLHQIYRHRTPSGLLWIAGGNSRRVSFCHPLVLGPSGAWLQAKWGHICYRFLGADVSPTDLQYLRNLDREETQNLSCRKAELSGTYVEHFSLPFLNPRSNLEYPVGSQGTFIFRCSRTAFLLMQVTVDLQISMASFLSIHTKYSLFQRDGLRIWATHPAQQYSTMWIFLTVPSLV